MIARNHQHLARNALLEAALGYANRGWAVVPVWWPDASKPTGCGCYDPGYERSHTCSKPGKHPIGQLVPHGVKGAARDAAVIAEWWRHFPEANVGIACGAASGFDVLDVDGDEGKATLAGLEREHGSVPTTIEAITGGGGRHVLFRYIPGLKNAVRFAPGLDIRTDDGLIVAEPSRHVSGGTYAWDAEHHPDEVELSSWPPWLEALVRAAPAAPTPATGADAGLIREGSRNATLTRLAGSMRRPGMSEAAIAAALLAENQARCLPPLPEDEVRGIAASVSKYVPGAPAVPATGDAPRAGSPATHDREAEVALLACLLKDPVTAEACCAAAGGISTPDFYDPGTRQVRQAMLAVQARGGRPDPVTLRLELEGKDGAGALAEILAALSTVATENAEMLARRVRELARGREMRRAARAVQEALAQGDEAGLAAAELAVREVTAQFAPAVGADPFGWATAQDLLAEPEEEYAYAWHGVLARGAVTLLAAAAKCGKSWILYGWLGSICRGIPWLGNKPLGRPVRALVVSEEPRFVVRRRLRQYGVTSGVDILTIEKMPGGAPWREIVDAAERRAGEVGAEIVIFDTISTLAGIPDENDNSAVNAALIPVVGMARRANVAAGVIHHARKDGGEGNDVIRGGSAFQAVPDCIVVVRRVGGKGSRKRSLDVSGRFPESPPDLVVVEYVKGENGEPDGYQLEGASTDTREDADRNAALVRIDRIDRLIVEVLEIELADAIAAGDPPRAWIKKAQIKELSGLSTHDLDERLHVLVRMERIQRGRASGRGGGFTHAAIGAPIPPPPGRGRRTSPEVPPKASGEVRVSGEVRGGGSHGPAGTSPNFPVESSLAAEPRPIGNQRADFASAPNLPEAPRSSPDGASPVANEPPPTPPPTHGGGGAAGEVRGPTRATPRLPDPDDNRVRPRPPPDPGVGPLGLKGPPSLASDVLGDKGR